MKHFPCLKCQEVHTGCTAHLRRQRGSTEPLRPCRKHPVKDSNVCALHGGKTPRGFASPHFINGEHSKFIKTLPAAERDEFDQMLSNQKATLLENITLANLRLMEMIELLDCSRHLEIGEELLIGFKELEESICHLPEESFAGIKAEKNPLTILARIERLILKENGNSKPREENLELNEQAQEKITELENTEVKQKDELIKSEVIKPEGIKSEVIDSFAWLEDFK